jgi:phosphopentomutase
MMKRQLDRVVLMVLDSLGVGAAPDAVMYGDSGSNTLGHVAEELGGLSLPNLGRLGLGNILPVLGVPAVSNVPGAWGRMQPQSPGKDSISGHWEIAGLILDRPFPVYPAGFPREIIKSLEKTVGHKLIGNIMASGTEIIRELGEEHLETGNLIVYTSADSVLQIAAHEDILSVEQLYQVCQLARQILKGEHAVARIIARPFKGPMGNFQRAADRKDFSLRPPQKTLLNYLQEEDYEVVGIGKVGDIFADEGIKHSYPTKDNKDGLERVVEVLESGKGDLILVNLGDFDVLYGHRNDTIGYGRALEAFDFFLPALLESLKPTDLLIITADHGCDPTFEGTDHTREYVPLLATGPGFVNNISLGTRKTFADVAATIADFYNINWRGPGISFARKLFC